MSELQVTGAGLGILLSLGAMVGSKLATRSVTTLASWQAYTLAFAIRLVGFLVIAVFIAILPLNLLSREAKVELFLAFVITVALGYLWDVIWLIQNLRKR